MNLVTQKQLLKFLSLHIIATVVAFLTGRLLQVGGFNAPLGIVLGGVIALVITLLNIKFAQRRPKEHFAAYGADIISRWLHYPLIMSVVVINLIIIVLDLWKTQDFLLQFYLLDTPPYIVIAISCLCIAYTARFGVKSVFRAAEGLFYISMLSFVIIPFLVQTNVEWFMLEGFITHINLQGAWMDAYYMGSIFGEAALIIYIFPYLSKPERTKKTVLLFKALAVTLILIHLILIILVLGPDLAGNLNYPELEMIRLIKSGSYLETLDPIIIALWLITIFIKLSFLLLISCQIVANVFKLKHDESIVYPMVILVIVAVMYLAKTPSQLAVFDSEVLTYCFYGIECLPLLYYVVDIVRGLGKRKKVEDQT